MGEKQKVVVDTSKLMEDILEMKSIIDDYQIVIPEIVLEELDNHKDNYKDTTRSYKGRNAIRFINKHYDKFTFGECDDEIVKNDNKIIDVAIRNKAMVFTGDICMQVKARAHGLNILETGGKVLEQKYNGYKEVYVNDKKNDIKLAEIYSNRICNPFDLKLNEYLLIKDENERLKDKMKYTKDGFVSFNNRILDSSYIGKIKPRDEYQSCLIDSLINNQMTMVRGKAGSGKSLLSLAYALSEIESGKYNKLIVISNCVKSKHAGEIGFLPGTKLDKMMGSFVGGMLSSKLGGAESVYQMIGRDKLEIMNMSEIRGYDTTDMKAIIYVVEAQNMNIDLMKLAIQRVGEDCKLIIDGDNNSQVDMAAFEGENNGMTRISNVFKGQDFYGEVELRNIHRSRIAKIADRM